MEYQAAVAEGSHRWNELVAEWQQLDEQEEQATTAIQWRRGDILLEVEPIGSAGGAPTGTYERLRQFANEVGRELTTIIEQRQVAAAWPPEVRTSGATWSAHKALKGHPDRVKLIRSGLSYREAKMLAGHQPHSGTRPELLSEEHRQQRASDAIQTLTPQQKAAVVREALEDDEVTEQVVQEPKTRANLARVENRVDRQQQETTRERYELAEPRSVQIGAMADLEYALTKARTAFEDAREAADKMAAYGWPDDNRERAAVLHQRAMAAGELTGQALRGEDLDEELQALLEGGEG